ncbi:MAG TPA: hypothetical protein PL073_10590 [Spirochaetota bacterium]|nr:hypothetical protein [Spirochaetota bacterium]
MKRIYRYYCIVTAVLVMIAGNSAALEFSDFHGRWKLLYRGNYGYEFRFAKNYQAVCILYLQNNAVVFKGVYTLDNPQTLRINISQMKNVDNINTVYGAGGFSNVNSSYFLFHAALVKKDTKKMLELKPLSIVIDGITSEGYFEPVILLQKQ